MAEFTLLSDISIPPPRLGLRPRPGANRYLTSRRGAARPAPGVRRNPVRAGWTFGSGPCSRTCMTPAINAAKKANVAVVVREYAHDPSCTSYGLEAAEKLGVPPERVFKTLVVDLGGELVVAVIPVQGMLGLKQLAKASGAKKAAMADPLQVERATGYVLGGVSPLGQKKRLRTFIDISANSHPAILVSGGRRGLDIELAPADLARMTGASFAPLLQ
jgi:Cys-tRNA(Pro)/Cys-tRNA(Cys) deacylase